MISYKRGSKKINPSIKNKGETIINNTFMNILLEHHFWYSDRIVRTSNVFYNSIKKVSINKPFMKNVKV